MSYAATPNGPAVTRVQYTIRDLHPHGARKASRPLRGIGALYPGLSLGRTRSNSTQLSSPTLSCYIQREKSEVPSPHLNSARLDSAWLVLTSPALPFVGWPDFSSTFPLSGFSAADFSWRASSLSHQGLAFFA